MTNIAIEKIVDLDIDSFAAVEGRDGPQWKVTCSVPWSKPEYKQTFWFDRDAGSPPPEPGRYRCKLGRGGEPFVKKDGSAGDGSKDYHYNWFLNEFGLDPAVVATRDVPDPTPAQAHDENAKRASVAPQPLPAGTPPPFDVTRNSIERQTVFKAAVDLVISGEAADGKALEKPVESVQDLADDLWPVLQGIGNTAQDAPESSQAQRDFASMAKANGWTREQVRGALGMSATDFVQTPEPPKTPFEVNARWQSALDKCLKALTPDGKGTDAEKLPW